MYTQLCKLNVISPPPPTIQDYSDQHPENAAEIKLTMAQLKISQGSHDYFIMIKIIMLTEIYGWNDSEVFVDYVIFKIFASQ